jgi:beta-glucosidase
MSRSLRPCLLGLLALLGCIKSSPERTSPVSTGVQRASPDVERLLALMTLEEKIGQMTQVDLHALKPESDLAHYFIGSVLSGGDSPVSPNTPSAWADSYDRLQRHALSTRLGIPILYGIDAVHGHNLVHGAVIFPHNIGLGATRDAALVERVGRATAEEVAATGIDWTFAPCVATPRDERWGRTYEGFGESADLSSELGAAAVRGLQTADLGQQSAVLACAKHFIGDGATLGGKDQGDAQISEQTLRALHLPAYREAVRAGVGSVMVSYSSWNGRKMHGQVRLIQQVLKGELGFQGFVVTDWEGIDKVPGDYADNVVQAINAGIDMVMVPNQYKRFIAIMQAAVKDGRIPMARIDDALRRILRKKVELKLWERPLTERALAGTFGSAEHRQIARQAVRESLVLLKNERAALPIPSAARVHVGGSKADDLGIQCGGWTVGWMGKRGPITKGTTLLAALREALPSATQVSFSADGSGGEQADVAVAVVGEEPYAEFKGDRQDLSLSAEDLSLIERMQRSGRPLIVVLLSGRPLVLGRALTLADALVAAWLPGSEGQGIADVLLGAYAPTGKLPHSWPRALEQVPINVGDPAYDPLFPYGFGLSYGVR